MMYTMVTSICHQHDSRAKSKLQTNTATDKQWKIMSTIKVEASALVCMDSQ